MKRVGWLGERFCLLCAVIFCVVIWVQCLQAICDGAWGATIVGVLCTAAALFCVSKFWKLGKLASACIIFAVRFLIAMALIFMIQTQPVSDFNTMYQAAINLSQGGRDYLDNIYFFNWAYQTGFVLYESVILRIFGTGQFALQVMNALWLGGIGALVYGIALHLMSRKAAAMAALLYVLYPAPYFLTTVLTNQHIAAFFYYLAIYLLVRNEKLSLPMAILIGAVIAIGNVMRPIGIILVLAILCWRLIRFLMGKDERKGRTLAGLLLIPISYFAVFSLCSGAVAWSGLNPEGLSNNLPMWKFVVGLNQESNGGWNREDYDSYYSLPSEEADQAMREVVQERLKAGPSALFDLALRKSTAMWGSAEDMYWGFGHLDGQRKIGPKTVSQYLQDLDWADRGVYWVAFTLAILGLLSMLLRGSKGGPALLLTFLLCGYYAVHLIVEVQSRYRYFLMPTVFLLAGVGLSAVMELHRKHIKSK